MAAAGKHWEMVEYRGEKLWECPEEDCAWLAKTTEQMAEHGAGHRADRERAEMAGLWDDVAAALRQARLEAQHQALSAAYEHLERRADEYGSEHGHQDPGFHELWAAANAVLRALKETDGRPVRIE